MTNPQTSLHTISDSKIVNRNCHSISKEMNQCHGPKCHNVCGDVLRPSGLSFSGFQIWRLEFQVFHWNFLGQEHIDPL